MAAPPSQRYRRIGFQLSGGEGGDARFDLVVRPEDLQRQEPSRLTVPQTLGGAWADAFGAGLAQITIRGTNGWKGGYLSSGEDAFRQLRDTVFVSWHSRREQSVKKNQDPNQIKLYFVDTLDDMAYVVAPKAFTTSRSKSRPLLIQYSVNMIVLGDGTEALGLTDAIVAALTNPLRWIAGVTVLGNIMGTIGGYIQAGLAVIGAIRGSVAMFTNIVVTALQSITSLANSLRGTFLGAPGALLAASIAITGAARNLWAALAADDSLPANQRIALMQTAAAFSDAECTLTNSFNVGRYFTSYEDLFGASNCSSTGGGSEWSTYAARGTNPFEAMFPAGPSLISITQEAYAAVQALRGDPLPLVGQTATLGRLAAAAGQGIKVTA